MTAGLSAAGAAHAAAGADPARARLARLQSGPGDGTGGMLFLATLKVRVPPDIWTGRFTASHPTLRMEVLNRTDVSNDSSVSDYWISGQPPGVWAREIGAYGDVLRVDSLAEVADGCLYRVTYRNPPVVGVYRRLRLPLQFPLRIHGGFITWEVTGRRTEFDEVLRFARSRDAHLQILSIRRRPLRSHLPFLTPAQQQLLTRAMAAGYFAVPRGISLTDLARTIGRSKSSVSESLALIEKKLLESALRPSTLLP